MSEPEDSSQPRRSQRERKQATQFISAESQSAKRKWTDDEETSDLTDLDAGDQSDEHADAEENFDNSKAKNKTGPRDKTTVAARGTGKRKTNTAAKKPRTDKVASATIKVKKSRARKGGANYDAEQIARETKILDDNPLFNYIMNPSAALQSVAEDFLESLDQSPAGAQAELVTCILRSCGCNHTIDSDQAVDYDGVVDALDNITEALKQDESPVYPLISKLAAFKPFRASLSEFLSRLVSSAAALGQLYATDLMATLQTWVIAMSSSQLRSFRHTASVVALEVETALCEVAAAVDKEAEVVSRQREGERKRKKGKSEPTAAREKELEGKAAEIRSRRTKLAEFLKEFVDGVFVHRYRDLDPNIRAECVRAMGLWFTKHPTHFIDGAYLRYVGWVLSDSNTQVRLEAVKALSLAYAQTEFIGIGTLQHFTERFKPRLVEMAVGDTELSVRVAVAQVLHAIDEHSLLEDEQRERLCLLVFDEEAKMRRAVGGFVKGAWRESLDERLLGKKPSPQDKKRAGVKAFAMLLVQWGRILDRGQDEQENEDAIDEERDGDQSEGSRDGRRREVVSLIGSDPKGRTALVVEALWDEIEPVSDWACLLDLLQLDHSTPDEEDTSQAQENRQGKSGNVANVDETWRLEEVEEGILLEVLLAALRRMRAGSSSNKKGEEDGAVSEVTRALIKALPRLFVKYQTDPSKMSDVLQLPQLMNLDMYLEMRLMTAYANLWDDVIKQFTSHSALIVLNSAVATIRYMIDATSLSNTNSMKVLELEEELASSLRDTIKGQDELDIASFSEDEVHALEAVCTRLSALAGMRDITSWMEEDEGGKQSSIWDIILALVERGKLGYREEEQMIDQALNLLTMYIIWKTRDLTAAADPSPEEEKFRDQLKTRRDLLIERLLDFTVSTQSNTSEGVRRAAFQNLLNLHILFCPAQTVASDGRTLPTAALALHLDDDAQYLCAGVVQAEIERYSEEIVDEAIARESDDEDDRVSHNAETVKTKGKRARKGDAHDDMKLDAKGSRLEKEYMFMGVIATFLRAIRAGAIHPQHTATLLAHYGRLGTSFDLSAKLMVDILREEGMYQNNGELVVKIVTQSLRESFTLVLDGVVPDEENAIALAKLLSSSFLIRGAQLSVVRRIDSEFIIKIHLTMITWVFKRITVYSLNGNKKARNRSLSFFKVLSQLTGALNARDFMKIKAHLEQELAQAKLEVTSTKGWDPYRAYEKRLSSLKDKGATGKKRTRAPKSAEVVTSDDGVSDQDNNILSGGIRQKSTRRRRRRTESDTEEGTAADGQEDGSPPDATKAKPRPRPAYKKAKTRSPSPTQTQSSAREGSTPLSNLSDIAEPEQVAPILPRKRPHSPSSDELSDHDSVLDEGANTYEHLDSQDSPSGQIQIRRKRVRH